MHPAIALQWYNGDTPSGTQASLRYDDPRVHELACPGHSTTSTHLEISVPIHCMSGIWSPYHDRRLLQTITWHGRLPAAPYRHPPVIALVDGQLNNRLCIAALPVAAEVAILWNLDQAGSCYRLTIEWHEAIVSLFPRIVCTMESGPVGDVSEKLLRQVSIRSEKLSACEYYEPCYCTWYAFHADMTADRIEATAELAADLGFGSIILDDGWASTWNEHLPREKGPSMVLTRWFRWCGRRRCLFINYPT